MIGLDTNVLLRLSDKTDPRQADLARKLVRKHGEGGSFVNEIVLAEYAWTLKRTYKLPRDEIAGMLEALLDSQELVVARAELVRRALSRYKTGPADFADYLLAGINQSAGCLSTATFDTDAQRSGDLFHSVSQLAAGGVETSKARDQDTIRLLVRSNPKTGKSALRFACYRDGMTVSDFRAEVSRRLGHREAAKCSADLGWDIERGFIRVEPHK